MTPIRIGFCINPSSNWLGGVNYFDNLITAIVSHESPRITPIIFVPDTLDSNYLIPFQDICVVKTVFLRTSFVIRVVNRLSHIILGYNPFIERLLCRYNIHLISHSDFLGRNSRFPSLPWIPDFQHHHLPHMFTQRELRLRDKIYFDHLSISDIVLVSSLDAKRDLCTRYSDYCDKARVLQFVSAKAYCYDLSDSSDILSLYQISTPFFLLPNQYWKHKNHIVALKALSHLKSIGLNINVVSTGSNHDYRNPSFFNSFLLQIDQLELNTSYNILGQIPYSHLCHLMKASIAIINPSLFEGWSTTVEESKSLGKSIILSDIAVHREQAPQRAYFFDPHDHFQLSMIMKNLLENYSFSIEQESSEQARADFHNSFRVFAKNYADIATELAKLSAI